MGNNSSSTENNENTEDIVYNPNNPNNSTNNISTNRSNSSTNNISNSSSSSNINIQQKIETLKLEIYFRTQQLQNYDVIEQGLNRQLAKIRVKRI